MNASNDIHEATILDEPHDRLIDVALAEVVSGKAPPDLSSRILADLAGKSVKATPMKTTRRQYVLAAVAVAATLLITTTLLFLPRVQSVREQARGSRASGNLKQVGQAALDKDEFAAAAPVAPVASADNSTPGHSPSPYDLTDDIQYGGPADKFNIGPKGQINESEMPRSELRSRSDELRSLDRVASTTMPQEQSSNVEEAGQPSISQLGDLGQKDQLAKKVKVYDERSLHGYRGQDTFSYQKQTWSYSGEQVAPTTGLATAVGRAEDEFGISLGYRWNDSNKYATGTGPGNPGDQYTRIVENPFIKAEGGAAVSTFSIDVDTASYANVRQFLTQMNQLPPPDAVRIEELINYFDYDYTGPGGSRTPPPAEPGADDRSSDNADETDAPAAPGSAGGSTDDAPFAAHVEVAGCPWAPEHRLVRIGIKGRELARDNRPKSNLVLLVDVSGSMDEPNKLPLVVEGLQLLTRELGENDRVAIVVYASSEGLVLPSTRGDQQKTILEALGKLSAGGSTAGGAGIQLAYQIAEDNFIEGGTNRVILCTDGDFNVGVTSTAELERLCEQKAKETRVFLSVLGFGRGNLNDAMMEAISNRGNGNHHYVDNRTEARRVLVEEMTGTLVTIAKDVKIQVEFNPRKVAGYRLIGYENRMLRTEDFNDDKKDAGEIGAGHTITALYEIVPPDAKVDVLPIDDLKYQKPSVETELKATEDIALNSSEELLTLKMRYKPPEGDTSKKLEWPATDDGKAFAAASQDFQFATAAAGFGLLLRDSQYKGNLTYGAVLEVSQSAVGEDKGGYRAEFVELVRKAKSIRGE